jgi:hypothetical protein
MPLNSAKLADLVNRARLKAPPSSIHHSPDRQHSGPNGLASPPLRSHARGEVTAPLSPANVRVAAIRP